MSGVRKAAQEVTTIASDMAKSTMDWAKGEVATNKETIGKFTDQMISDSDTARGMVKNFQDIANKDIGLAEGATDIRDAAMGQAGRANAIGDVQGQIQQKQLGVQDQQLANQQTQLGIQQDFRQDQAQIQAKANELYQQYAQTYAPAQARYMADAEAYGSPERAEQARAGAQASVGDQFQAARDAATRKLESWGVKPDRIGALDFVTTTKEAATKAAAGIKAAQDQELAGYALRDKAIAQGAKLPDQSTAMTGQANQAGSLVSQQGNVANTAGNVAAGFGQLANTAGANEIGATNAATGAMNVATGATNAATGAMQGATQASTGALAADTAAANITGAAGDLTNKTLATDTNAMGAAAPYLNPAVGGVNATTAAQKADYDNKMAQFKAESTNTSGLGALVGTALPIAAKAVATGGASLPFDMAGTAAKGMGDTEFEANIIGAAEGGAIPMSASPTQGAKTDDVKAMLNAGEFIIPKDITSWYGEKFFQNLIAKAQNEKGKAQAKPAVGPMPPGPPAVASGPSATGGV
jgi:hypothetical protein